jgi:hypothetical protein
MEGFRIAAAARLQVRVQNVDAVSGFDDKKK